MQRALALADKGANASEISRQLGIPRTTVRDWLNGAIPRSQPGRRGSEACVRCNPDRPFTDVAPGYVYLLGLYLGDGCISLHQRGVYKLRIVLDLKYPGIIASAEAAMREVRLGKTHTYPRRRQNCVEVSSYWMHWPCLFPQHDIGKKFERRIALAEWQMELVQHWPEEMLRGLIHSDGYRFTNTGRGNWVSPRYGFSQVSTDIQGIFCQACERVGVRWTKSGKRTIYVSHKADVELLDQFIGPKQ